MQGLLFNFISKYILLTDEKKSTAFYTEMGGLTPLCVVNQKKPQNILFLA